MIQIFGNGMTLYGKWDKTFFKGSTRVGSSSIKMMPLCKLHLLAASGSYTCAQDGVDTVQLALVAFSFHQLVQILHLHS